MKTTAIPSELRLLKRSISGSGLFGILLPFYAKYVLKDESSVAIVVGFALMIFAAIHLSYLRRLEKKLAT
jgi:hypothetical protein